MTVNVTVGVAWNDNGNEQGLRPSGMDITLYGSDGGVYTAQLTRDSDIAWTHTFTDMPNCSYSLEAVCPDNYSMKIDQETLTVYNTLRESAKPEETTEPVEGTAETTEPVEGTETEEPTEPVEGTETEEPTEPVEGTEEPTEPAEDTETEEPTEAPAIAYQRDEAGNLVLDEEGNPVAILPEGATEVPVQFQRDENGALVLDENGNPISTAMVPVTAQKVQTLEDLLNPNRSIDVYANWEGDKLYFGDDMTLSAVLNGYDNAVYTLQWQQSADASTWTDIGGATGASMTVQVTEENYLNYWRVEVIITDATAVDAE